MKLRCHNCGLEFERSKSNIKKDGRKYFCSKKCQNDFRRGENNPCWRGGLLQKQCVVCGEECVECNSAESLCVHHINYDKKDSRKENLITLCVSCHAKTNYNRGVWQARYEKYALRE